jgi:hypothetical protein
MPSAESVPQLWNSNVWGNNGGNGDLMGFDFVGAVQGVVWYSNFCGPPHPGAPCASQSPFSFNNFCRSTNPQYANPAAGDFELVCNGTNPCFSLCIDSAAESVGTPNPNIPPSILPLLPTVDALNRQRVVDLNTTTTVDHDADMGALERPTP